MAATPTQTTYPPHGEIITAPNEFEQWKVDARKEFQGLALEDLVKRFQKGYGEKERLERELAKCNAFFDVMRFEAIPTEMDKQGIEKIAYAGIGRVSLTADMQVSVKDKPGLFGWLRKNKLADLIQPTINPSTLKSFIKGRIKDGKKYPAEMLNVNPVTRASITKG